MYLLLFALVPVLFLFNSYLAMAGLVAAIVVMYMDRTRTPRAASTKRPKESTYQAGYEN